MKKLCVFLLVSLLISSVAAVNSYSGPWTLDQGKFWSETYIRYSLSKEYFDPEGNKHRWPDGGFSEIWDLEQKFEYGVTNNLNLHLGIPYAWSRWKNDWGKIRGDWGKFKREGFKEINLSAKYKFMDKPVTAAIQVGVFIQPDNTDQAEPPDLFDYGDSIEGRILVGKSFTIFEKLSYFSMESGYRLRSNWTHKSEYANSIPVFVEAGFAPIDWLMLKGEIDCSISQRGTGKIKDYYIWRVGPIINLLGKGFSGIEKGEQSSLNLELQYGRTFYGQGDASYSEYNNVSAAQEFVAKIQILF